MDFDETPHQLLAVAEAAHDVAAGFDQFLRPLPSHAPQIKGVIANCFAISSTLQLFATTIKNLPQTSYHWRDRWRAHRESIADVTFSVDYTFKDVHETVGRGFVDEYDPGSPEAYGRVWWEVNERLEHESGNAFSRRLELYLKFVKGLGEALVNGYTRDEDTFLDLASKVRRLYEVQHSRYQPDRSLSPSPPPPFPRKLPSFERRRPPGANAHVSPPPLDRRHRRPSMEYDHEPSRRDSRLPPAPEAPLRRMSSNAISSSGSSSSGHSCKGASRHWLPKLFDIPPPSSALVGGGRSACFDDHDPAALEKLAHGEYERLMRLPFENGDLIITFYQRPSDCRARVLAESRVPGKFPKLSVQALTSMTVMRSGSFLKFSIKWGRKPELWGSLRFKSYEQLVILHNSFLALRSHDSGHPMDDDKIHHEECEFKAVILDDNFQHTLKLFVDEDSDGIRLQASALSGELKKTPIWTAFITHHIHSPLWARRVSPKVIHLADLHRYCFLDAYTPQMGPGGEHELSFEHEEAAGAFMHAIEYLARPPRRSKSPKAKEKGKGHGKGKHR